MNTGRLRSCFGALLLMAACGCTTLPADANAAGGGGMLPLWRLDGTRNRIYLLGSVHFLRQQDFPLDPAIMQAFADAEVVYMEIDMDDQDPLESAQLGAELGRDPDGRTLAELLGDTAWRDASRRLRELGIDAQLLQPFEPWFAALLVAQLRLAQLGFESDLGIENQLTSSALKARKEIRGLETTREQLEILDRLPPTAQRQFLEANLDEAETVGEQMDTIVAAWRRGDARVLSDEMLSSFGDQRDLYERIVVARNRGFARNVARLANDGRDYLVVVGALHLVGRDSVLRMLEETGLPAVQLRSQAAR